MDCLGTTGSSRVSKGCWIPQPSFHLPGVGKEELESWNENGLDWNSSPLLTSCMLIGK